MPGLVIAMTRLAVGGLSLIGGAFWLVINLVYPNPRDALVGVVAAGGGVVVLAWHRLRLPARIVVPAVIAGGLAGAAAGLAVHRVSTGGMFGWIEYRGWPFEWLSRGAVADDPAEAQRLGQAAGWSAEPLRLAVDAVLHTYGSLILIVGLTLLVRYFAGNVPDRTR
jgi:hypothetical protein